MPAPLPTIFGAEAQYPVVKTISFLTDITVGRNGSEQRRMARPPLIRFSLKFHSIQFSDMIAMQAHFLAAGGSFASNITLTIFGVTYSNLSYNADQILFDRDHLSYSFSMTFEQSIPFTTAYGTAMVNSGSSGWTPPYQIPYDRGYLFKTNKVTQPSGPRYAYQVYGGGIRNHPTAPFGIWGFKFPIATETDATVIETAFIQQRGRLLIFSFRDPETMGSTAGYFQNCRFDNDELNQTYMADGSVTTDFSIRSVSA